MCSSFSPPLDPVPQLLRALGVEAQARTIRTSKHVLGLQCLQGEVAKLRLESADFQAQLHVIARQLEDAAETATC